MKILKNLFILAVSLTIVAPMIYFFLATFFSSNLVFWIAVCGAVYLAVTGVIADQKNNA
jgi:hypothetical protein